MNYRNLTGDEISRLISQGCYAENWSDITVDEGFTPLNIRNTGFSGKVRLGRYSMTMEIEKNLPVRCGISNSVINNCEIGSECFISEVKYLSNYKIEDDVAVSNAGSVAVTGETSFGNGTEIEVLNEGGGRELILCDILSSQIAYLAVLYRHDKDFTSGLLNIIREYCLSMKSDTGLIETGSRILDTTKIRNVIVGKYSLISGAAQLEEGTIRSCREAPVFIGPGVIARKFVILSGSGVDSGAVLEKTFIGQGVKAGRQISAENSVFFANCEAFHSEACSLFAGPYSVTHHRSTLLISSLVSFFNAGSGTNQSNHMYKLGPIHQAILERGSKTGSFSYMLQPCHIGAYSVVVGKHYSNFDASEFPFSYITEEKGKSELTPAMNLFTVGTKRDIDKWPARDRRKDPEKHDLIHFDLFSPYIAEKIAGAIAILNNLEEKTDKKQDFVNYKGLTIRRLLFRTTRKYYEMALKIFTGQEIIKRLETLNENSSVVDIKRMLASESDHGTGEWVDICGLFSPKSRIARLADLIKTSKVDTLEKLNAELLTIFNNYNDYSWEWCSEFILRQTGSKPENLPVEVLISIINDWKINSVKFNNMILKDAEKEFDSGSKIGFGLDGDNNARENDFLAVRGAYDKNKFVTGLQNESKEIENLSGRLTDILGRLK